MALVLLALALAACSRATGDTASRLAGGLDAADVERKPWPERITPTNPWPAKVAGVGPRVTFTMAGTIAGGLGRTTVDVGPPPADRPTGGRALVLPGGERWYPQKPFRIEAEGDLPFVAVDAGAGFSFQATGRDVVVQAGFGALLAAAGGTFVAHGEFVREDGTRAADLSVPPGTSLADGSGGTGSDVVTGRVEPVDGTPVSASGDGEAAVAGAAVGDAEGHTWEALDTAVEAEQVTASATFDGVQWHVEATAEGARQLWVDGWPVADTLLHARSYSVEPGFFDRNRLLKVEWVNAGQATAQILEAEGSGPGALRVGFDLNKTLGHDAGLGVRRGDRVTNLRGGGDVDSNLPPGDRLNRELSYDAGQAATLVLRGNFPEVRVDLAVPGT